MTSSPPDPGFIPRPELATILHELKAGRSVWLHGPPGSGKTRLLRDITDHLKAEGPHSRVVTYLSQRTNTQLIDDVNDAASGSDPNPAIVLIDDADSEDGHVGKAIIHSLAIIARRQKVFVVASRAAPPPLSETEGVGSFLTIALEPIGPDSKLPPSAVLRLAFDPSVISEAEALELMLALDDLYRALGGEALVILDDYSPTVEPRGAPV